MSLESRHSTQVSKKRKDAPQNQSRSSTVSGKRPKLDHRAKQRDARTLSAQSSCKAFNNGELNVDTFVKAREYEIHALANGISSSKKALTKRAFQQVPQELRRRTASHNVRRVPKRMRARAAREMLEDNAPTVTARRRKPTKHMRLRLETVKRLRALKLPKNASRPVEIVRQSDDSSSLTGGKDKPRAAAMPKNGMRKQESKSSNLVEPPLAKAKFRKRQIHKSWLPTHVFHAKRAHMTPPRDPLWRFAIPLSPSSKCYRPTHRAASMRGAVAWDMSYVASIGLEGQQTSVESMFRMLGVSHYHNTVGVRDSTAEKWTNGSRVWQGLVYEHKPPHKQIAPIMIAWAARHEHMTHKRKAIIRVHPSAFLDLWEEITRLAETIKPRITIEDLRFEIGSIEITGPGSTEALLAALWPSEPSDSIEKRQTQSQGALWMMLAGLTDVAMLPRDIVLSFDIQDPRLHLPSQTIALPRTPEGQGSLLDLLAAWPFDGAQKTGSFLDRRCRLAASSTLPSQRAISRRKALAVPGQTPVPLPSDPRIPVMLYCAESSKHKQDTWTLLLPWKCVQPVWYSIIYYPLSTGGQPRYGGLEQKRQLAFERGIPWFPGDYPHTNAGWRWELQERKKRQNEWIRKPKSKRSNWETLELGNGRKGEIGSGWACDWERLILGSSQEPTATTNDEKTMALSSCPLGAKAQTRPHLTCSPISATRIGDAEGNSVIVRVSILARGIPLACARIYRLPVAEGPRQCWLTLYTKHHESRKHHGPKHGLPMLPKDCSPHAVQRHLAQTLLEPPRVGEDGYPPCPLEEDLIGFITTGGFHLREGSGMGIGSILAARVSHVLDKNGGPRALCIVRNAGSSIGRLGEWERI